MSPQNVPTSGGQDEAGQPLAIVGVGASAGGLEAVRTLLSGFPSDSGLAFVVVMHLAPDRESHLSELLTPHVKMPVQQVNETVALEPNRVYVIPPNANLDAIDSHLRLSDLEEQRRSRAPIDHFFRTLARTHHGHAVAVVLSGSGSDGTLGIKEIKGRGGLTVAQDPSEAEYDGMPQSAVATGMVDLVLKLDAMSDAVLSYVRTRPRVELDRADESDDSSSSTRQLMRIFGQIRARTGRDFSRYKRSTMMRRITRRMQIHRMEELADYAELLRSDSDEAHRLSEDLLITVTNFFRDPEVYEKLEREVIPALLENRSPDNALRVWTVGCATGEEAYSIAMLLLEAVSRHDHSPQIQIFASDLHDHSLERARGGFYPGDIATDVSPERLRRFFKREDGGYRINKEVREVVVFAPHNLLSDPPFSRLDLISCRNLLIYLQRDVQREVTEIFHYALRPGGYLLVGSSETVEASELFLTDDKKQCTYRRREVPTPNPRLPVFPIAVPLQQHRISQGELEERVSYGELHARMVERYAPPSLLVAPDDTVAHLSEHAGRYLMQPGGELTTNVFRLVREELRIELRAALFEARQGNATRSRPVSIPIEGRDRSVMLDVRPDRDPQKDGFALVLFDERESQSQTGEVPVPATATAPEELRGHERERELEIETDLLRQRLQAIIEEYETGQEEMRASNEELQSANEELRSTLEELETSKEELHSMNEELQTANQENRHKVEELGQLSSDLQNLLAATDIATLFLDRELRIMRFTPNVERIFSIRMADRGRPISDLRRRLGYDELESDAASVLRGLIPVEREVEEKSGRVFLTRVLPYRSSDDRIEGVVITFVDISRRKRAEEALRRSEGNLSRELQAMVRLHELVTRLLACPDLDNALEEVLGATIAITGADHGVVQLLDRDACVLSIAAQRGFEPEVLEHFATVEPGEGWAASRALERRERVVVGDVESDMPYRPHRETARLAGYRGVQATPLLARDGTILGTLSTHYAEPFEPSERDLRILDLYAIQAAEFIERVQGVEMLREKTRLLETEDERKGFFLATLGHELRNPLAALDSAMRAIQEGAPDVPALHTMISQRLAKLSRLVDDLLEVARVTRGSISLNLERVDFADVVRTVVADAEREIRTKGQQLVLEAPDQLPLRADTVRLEQVVANLLSNASKYTPVGGRIEVRLSRDRDDAVLAVRDDGMGISSADCDQIFEPFVQRNPGLGGLGIGLPLVKRLVQLHGGSIFVASDGEGCGSVFTVRVPIGDVGEEPRREQSQERGWKLPPSARILVVDDVEDAADSLAMLLRVRGADVRVAYTGLDAIEILRSWRPEVAIVDIALPDVSGHEVAVAARRELGDAVLLLAATGFGAATGGFEADTAFDDRLVKPIDQQRLREHLERRLQPADGAD